MSGNDEPQLEWNCARCGQVARARSWALVESIGWRQLANDEVWCVVCVKKEPAGFAPRRPPDEAPRGVLARP
jgi:hypothetical protein